MTLIQKIGSIGLAILCLLAVFKLGQCNGQGDKDVVAAKFDSIKTEYKKVSDALSIAESKIVANEEMFNAEAESRIREAVSASSHRLIDSIKVLNGKLISLTTASGVGTISGSGQAKEGQFQDNWLSARIKPLSNAGAYDLKYDFNFGVGEVTAVAETDQGLQTEIYSVFLKSLRDPTQILYVGDYKRTKLILYQEKLDMSRWFWNDLSVNFDAVFSKDVLETGISGSPFSFTSGGKTEKAHILRFPDVGLSSDFKASTHVYGGARLNVGHFLPVLQDFYVGLKYGLGIGNASTGFLLSVGTTL